MRDVISANTGFAKTAVHLSCVSVNSSFGVACFVLSESGILFTKHDVNLPNAHALWGSHRDGVQPSGALFSSLILALMRWLTVLLDCHWLVWRWGEERAPYLSESRHPVWSPVFLYMRFNMKDMRETVTVVQGDLFYHMGNSSRINLPYRRFSGLKVCLLVSYPIGDFYNGLCIGDLCCSVFILCLGEMFWLLVCPF